MTAFARGVFFVSASSEHFQIGLATIVSTAGFGRKSHPETTIYRNLGAAGRLCFQRQLLQSVSR